MTTATEAAPPRSSPPVRRSPPLGIPCPGCGGRNLDVMRTRPHPGRIVRSRRCLDCRREFRTAERVESATL